MSWLSSDWVKTKKKKVTLALGSSLLSSVHLGLPPSLPLHLLRSLSLSHFIFLRLPHRPSTPPDCLLLPWRCRSVAAKRRTVDRWRDQTLEQIASDRLHPFQRARAKRDSALTRPEEGKSIVSRVAVEEAPLTLGKVALQQASALPAAFYRAAAPEPDDYYSWGSSSRRWRESFICFIPPPGPVSILKHSSLQENYPRPTRIWWSSGSVC